MDRDTEPAEVVGTPKEPPATVASLRHKSYRHTASLGTGGSGSERRDERRSAPHRNSTAEQQQGHPGAKRAYRRKRTAPRHANRRGPNHASDGQRTAEATRQKTPTPSTNQPLQGHGEPGANERRRQRSKKTTSNQALQLATYNTQQSCPSVFDPLSHLVISLSMFMRFASSPGSLLGWDNCGFLDLTNDG